MKSALLVAAAIGVVVAIWAAFWLVAAVVFTWLFNIVAVYFGFQTIVVPVSLAILLIIYFAALLFRRN